MHLFLFSTTMFGKFFDVFCIQILKKRIYKLYSLSVTIQKKKIKSNVSKPWQQNLSYMYERVFGESLMERC